MFLSGDNNISKRDDIRLKISLSKKGKTTWNKGKHQSEEWRLKIGLSNTKPKKQNTCKNCGNTFETIPSITRMFCSRKCIDVFKKGSNHPMWITDRSKLSLKQERNDSSYREWRKNVKDRYMWKCKISDCNCKGKLVAHHILPWSKFPELRYNINNGITLCRFHHPLKRDDEKTMIPIFQECIRQS